jgi:flagellar biosynthesis/type III secretory pathway M-ring protein FliF/YscJ
MKIIDKIAGAYASARDGVADARDRFSEAATSAKQQVHLVQTAAPTLTTGLLIAAVLIGSVAGWFISKPFTRWAVNKEWRQTIAKNSSGTLRQVALGNAEADATDRDIISALGESDAKLSNAERHLKNLANARPQPGDCRIPADRLRQ